jgi:hypothetical protein
VAAFSTPARFTVINCRFSNNSAIFGGAGIHNKGTLTVIDSSFSDNFGNISFGNGGGVLNEGTMTVIDSTFSDNGGPQGGGMENVGKLTIINSSFSENGAKFGGGGLVNGGILSISNSTFSANSGALGGGGGIVNGGILSIVNTTFSDNDGGFGEGGGILNHGKLTILNSTFSGNTTAAGVGNGGAIFNDETLTVTSSTFFGNGTSTGFGSSGGGIYNLDTASLKNTIVAGSIGGNCSGTITDAGYNISDDASCAFSATGSRNSTKPMLDAGGLENNGGPTKTISLLAGSPAIDAIPVANCTDQESHPISTDQRGALRPDVGEDRCDIGAYEVQDLAGEEDCQGKNISALVRQFGGLVAAAAALGFPIEEALLTAIHISCGG